MFTRDVNHKLCEPSFGQLLQQHRARSGFRQVDVARQVRLSTSYLSAIESGARPPPSNDLVQALARALKLSADETVAFMATARSATRTLRLPQGTSADACRAMHVLVDRLAGMSVARVDLLSRLATLDDDTVDRLRCCVGVEGHSTG